MTLRDKIILELDITEEQASYLLSKVAMSVVTLSAGDKNPFTMNLYMELHEEKDLYIHAQGLFFKVGEQVACADFRIGTMDIDKWLAKQNIKEYLELEESLTEKENEKTSN